MGILGDYLQEDILPMADVDIEDYEKMQSVIKLMSELSDGEKSAKAKGFVDISDVEKMLGVDNV